MNALLKVEIPTNQGELLMLGLQVLLIGIIAVFAVLVVIWAIIALFKFALSGSKKAEPVQENAVTTAFAPSASVNQADEIVAVIAAAIAAAESESPNFKFRVVSFKRM